MRVDTPKCAVQSSQFWERLLRDIRRHEVVPIVGKDLLVIEMDGRSITLERFLAEKLAESCGESLGDNQDLRHAIALYKESTNDPKLKYLKFNISKILREQPPPIPKPLLQLAEIDGFTLYVTTNFDSLLHRALVEAKRCRAEELQALAFDPKKGSGRAEEGGRQWDLFPDFELDRQKTPVVYHLFGMDGPDPDGNDWEDYAVTEEELLEYLMLAEQPHRQPSKLFEYCTPAVCSYWAPAIPTGLPDFSCGWLLPSGCSRNAMPASSGWIGSVTPIANWRFSCSITVRIPTFVSRKNR